MPVHRLIPKLLACFAWACLCAAANAEKLVIYGDESYAPVIYADQGGPAGILPAIFKRISKDTGDTYELTLVPWKRALSESMRGRGGITNISRNTERDKLYDFSVPIYDDDIQLVVLKGKEFAFAELKDLKGKTIGGAQGASYGDEVDKAIADGIIVMDRDPHQLPRLKKLLLGRIDVAIVGNGFAGFEQLIASDPELAANRSKFVVLPRALVRDPLHLAFVKSMSMSPALKRFDKAMEALKKTAEYRRIVGQSN